MGLAARRPQRKWKRKVQGGSEASRRRAGEPGEPGEPGESGEPGEPGERSASAGRFPFESHGPIKKITQIRSRELQNPGSDRCLLLCARAQSTTSNAAAASAVVRTQRTAGRRDGGAAGNSRASACTRRSQSKTARACLVVLLWIFLCPLGLERKKKPPC